MEMPGQSVLQYSFKYVTVYEDEYNRQKRLFGCSKMNNHKAAITNPIFKFLTTLFTQT